MFWSWFVMRAKSMLAEDPCRYICTGQVVANWMMVHMWVIFLREEAKCGGSKCLVVLQHTTDLCPYTASITYTHFLSLARSLCITYLMFYLSPVPSLEHIDTHTNTNTNKQHNLDTCEATLSVNLT